MSSASSSNHKVNTIIRIHYDPPAGGTLGVRCGESGGDGNEWQKFYYATKKGDTYVCTITMDRGDVPIEFKPVIQYNAPTPPFAQAKFNFSSPDLRKSFLSSSSSSLFKTQSQADFGNIKSPNVKSPSAPSPNISAPGTPPPNTPSPSAPSIFPNTPKTPKSSLFKDMMMSPLHPSAFSVAGELDESYSVGANYMTTSGKTIDVYPWFFHWQGSLETIENVESKILNYSRNVIVYLPPSYHENKLKKYPVLIMNDAHNLFYHHLSFAGNIWKIPFSMDELCAAGVIKETIIVGITPIKREYEYLPSTLDQKANGGGADLYLDFIGKELKPILAEKYRITGEYGIAGSSYGGIISLYAWLTRPEEYTKCGCYSPSLRWHKNYMFAVAQTAIQKQLDSTHNKGHLLYIDAGTESDQLTATCKMARMLEKAICKGEKRAKAHIPHETSGQNRAAEVFDKLVAATGIYPGSEVWNVNAVQTVGAVLASGKLMVNVGQGHNHSEDSWAKRTPLALSFLLRDEQREDRWAKMVVDDISHRVMFS